MKVTLPDEQSTVALAGRLRAALPESLAGLTILLEGELGAGKSTFARGLIRAMGHRGPVPSPTYTLVEPYDFPEGMIYHIDFYRIADEEELRYLGWHELENGLRLVEWPDRAPGLSETADLRLQLAYDGDGRKASFTAISPAGSQLLQRLGAAKA